MATNELERPCAIVAHTVKGKGVSFMENNPSFHGKAPNGAEWTNKTGFPMVFGVFAGRKDSPISILNRASNDMVRQYEIFLNNESWRNQVIKRTSL